MKSKAFIILILTLITLGTIGMFTKTASAVSYQDQSWNNDMNKASYWNTYFSNDARTASCTKYENHSGWIPAEYDAAVTKKGSDVVRVYPDLTNTGAFQATHPQGDPPMSWVMKCKFTPKDTTTTSSTTSTTSTTTTTSTTVPESTTTTSTTTVPETTTTIPETSTTIPETSTTVPDTTTTVTIPESSTTSTTIPVTSTTTQPCDIYVPSPECTTTTSSTVPVATNPPTTAPPAPPTTPPPPPLASTGSNSTGWILLFAGLAITGGILLVKFTRRPFAKKI